MRSESRSFALLALVWGAVYWFGGRSDTALICMVILLAAYGITRALENLTMKLTEKHDDQ